MNSLLQPVNISARNNNVTCFPCLIKSQFRSLIVSPRSSANFKQSLNSPISAQLFSGEKLRKLTVTSSEHVFRKDGTKIDNFCLFCKRNGQFYVKKSFLTHYACKYEKNTIILHLSVRKRHFKLICQSKAYTKYTGTAYRHTGIPAYRHTETSAYRHTGIPKTVKLPNRK